MNTHKRTLEKTSFPMGEAAFFLGMLFCSVGITFQTKANLGLSMVAAPAYILSLKIPWLTFGMGECFVQGLLFVTCCVWTRSFQYKRLLSFVAAVPYAWVLDRVMGLFSGLSPVSFGERLAVFLIGCLVLSAGIAFFVKSYLPCQVYEMFVKCIAEYEKLPFGRVKFIYDWTSLLVAVVLAFLFFGKIVGIGLGTVLFTVMNAPLIAMYEKLLERFLDFRPAFPGLRKYFV